MSLIAPDFLTVDYDAMRGEDVPNPDGWVFHWPASKHVFTGALFESKKYLQAWERYHVDTKGWRGIAYDYAVDMAGRKFRLRGTGRSAATSGDYDEDGVPNNTESDAILCVIGMSQEPSQLMVEAAFELVAELGGRRDYIIPHYAAKGTVTDCPGPYVTGHIVDALNQEDDMPYSEDDLRRIVTDAVHQATFGRTSPETFAERVAAIRVDTRDTRAEVAELRAIVAELASAQGVDVEALADAVAARLARDNEGLLDDLAARLAE